MTSLGFDMAKAVVLLVCCALLSAGVGQHARDRVIPWTQRIQWENNGHVYSLLSTGTEYHSPLHSRRESRVYLSSRSQAASPLPPGDALAHFRIPTTHSGASATASTIMAPDGRHYILGTGRAPGARHAHLGAAPRPGPAGAPGARRYAAAAAAAPNNSALLSESSGSGAPRRSPSTTEDDNSVNRAVGSPTTYIHELRPERARVESGDAQQSVPDPTITSTGVVATARGALETSEEEAIPDNMVGDDPRKNHRNTVFYNVYPSGGRAVGARARRPPPGTGYGTRYFHNGERCVGTPSRIVPFTNARFYAPVCVLLCAQVSRTSCRIRTPSRPAPTSSACRCMLSGAQLKKAVWRGKCTLSHCVVLNRMQVRTADALYSTLSLEGVFKTNAEATSVSRMPKSYQS